MSDYKMKFSNLLSHTLIGLLVMLMVSCSQSGNFMKSSVIPAANVTLKIKQDDNGNYRVKIDAENMAQPQELIPEKSIYVVWVKSNSGAYNIGQLTVDKNLNASLTSLTPHKPERIIVTAENDGEIAIPGSQVVLESNEIIY